MGNPAAPAAFLDAPNSVCSDWASMVSKFDDDTKAWLAGDPNMPANQWTTEQRAINDAVMPVMTDNANELERLGRQSNNPTLEDFAVLAAQYQRAYVKALPTYTSSDSFLIQSATFLVNAINFACKAAG
jgi:hypothetical protein